MGELVPPFIVGLYTAGAPTAELHPGLVVDPSDVILNKPRYGAFHSNDLESGEDRAVALLDNGQLHQSQSGLRSPSTQDGDRKADQARRQASGETGVSSISRNSTRLFTALLPNLPLWDRGLPLTG